jgi:ABC-type glycerol-3-phosphate transport system substrate-binding protein
MRVHIAVALLVAAALAGCAGSSDDEPTTTSGSGPSTTWSLPTPGTTAPATELLLSIAIGNAT